MASLLRPQLLQLSALLILTTALAHAQDTIDTSNPGACKNTTDPCVATYHNDNARDGVNSNELVLTQTLFNPIQSQSNFGLIGSNATKTSTVIDGLIYAQPLYLTGVSMNTTACPGTKNIVIVATENNSV